MAERKRPTPQELAKRVFDNCPARRVGKKLAAFREELEKDFLLKTAVEEQDNIEAKEVMDDVEVRDIVAACMKESEKQLEEYKRRVDEERAQYSIVLYKEGQASLETFKSYLQSQLPGPIQTSGRPVLQIEQGRGGV
jgi:hypothetical protein